MGVFEIAPSRVFSPTTALLSSLRRQQSPPPPPPPSIPNSGDVCVCVCHLALLKSLQLENSVTKWVIYWLLLSLSSSIYCYSDRSERVSDKIQLKSHNNSFSSAMWLITNGLKIVFKFIIWKSIMAAWMSETVFIRVGLSPFYLFNWPNVDKFNTMAFVIW